MHRHGYQGTKFHRERDQREALVQSLAESLILHGSIRTTLPKAKAVVPYVEKLITKAKKGDLHNRRQIIAALQTLEAAHRLVDELAPKFGGRTSGHLRITRLDNRRGDNAEMARVSFVDDLHEAPVAKSSAARVAAADTTETETKSASTASKAAPVAPRTVRATDRHLSHKPAAAGRKSGER